MGRDSVELATLLHKIGIAEVGAFPWAAALTLCSALALAVSLPLLRWKQSTIGLPARKIPWFTLIVLAGLLFALQQSGLQLALQATQGGYAVAVTSASILRATAFGIALFRERSAARTRIAGALLISFGASLIAFLG